MGCGPSNDNGASSDKDKKNSSVNEGPENQQDGGVHQETSAPNPLTESSRGHRGDSNSESKLPGHGGVEQDSSAKSPPHSTKGGENVSGPTPREDGHSHSRDIRESSQNSPRGDNRGDQPPKSPTAKTPGTNGGADRGASSTPGSATTVGSSQQAPPPPPPPVNPAVMLPTHVIQDATGRKVASCISSRTKLHIVTRWIDSAMRYRERLPERVWPNPQEDAGRERNPLSTSGSTVEAGNGGGGASALGFNNSQTPTALSTPHLGDSLNPVSGGMNASVSQMSLSTTGQTNASVKANFATPQQVPLTGSTSTPLSPGFDRVASSSQAITVISSNNNGGAPAPMVIPEQQ